MGDEMNKKRRKNIFFLSENVKGRDHLEDLDVDERII
jgi:hypothetical protein